MKLILMAAITVDGMIGKTSDHLSTDWTSRADTKLFISITKQARAIVMGRTTYDTIGRPLPKRLNFILTSTPEKFESQTKEGLLEFHKKSPQETCDYLKSKDFDEAILCGGAKTYAQFFEAGLIDEVYLTIEPKLFGNGINLLGDNLTDIDLELLSFEKIGDNSLFVKYKVKK